MSPRFFVLGNTVCCLFSIGNPATAKEPLRTNSVPASAGSKTLWSGSITEQTISTYLDATKLKVSIVPVGTGASLLAAQQGAEVLEAALDESDKTDSVTMSRSSGLTEVEIVRTAEPADADTILVVRVHAAPPAAPQTLSCTFYDRRATVLAAFQLESGAVLPPHTGGFPARNAPRGQPGPSVPLQPVMISAPAFGNASYHVVLRDGTILVGHLVELVPNRSLVLQLLSGEIRTLDWTNVTEHGEGVSPSPPRPRTPDPAPTRVSIVQDTPRADLDDERPFERVSGRQRDDEDDAPGSRGSVVATFTTATPGVSVYRLMSRREASLRGTDTRWSTLCTPPCIATLDRSSERTKYSIQGREVPSADLDLEEIIAPRVNIHIRPGRESFLKGGVALTVLGSISAILGIVTTAVTVTSNGTYDYATDRLLPINKTPYYAGGGVLLGVGVAMVGASIPLLVIGKTSVSFREQQVP